MRRKNGRRPFDFANATNNGLIGLFSAFILVLAHAPSRAQEVSFPGRLAKGRTFYQQTTTDMDQEMKVMDFTVTSKQRQTTTFTWFCEGKDKDGNWVVCFRILAMKLELLDKATGCPPGPQAADPVLGD